MQNVPPDDPAQSQRFLDMARTVEADEDDTAFEAKVKAIARHKPKQPDPPGADEVTKAKPLVEDF